MHGVGVGIETGGRRGTRGDGVGFGRRPGRVASRLAGDFHAHPEWLHVTLAMLASLFDEELAIVDDDADKTLVAQDVATLSVGVGQAPIGEFAQAAVLPFCQTQLN